MSIKVEAFATPGCSKCAQMRDSLKRVVDEFGPANVTWRDVNVLEEIDYAVELGVLMPPSIAIEGELVFPKLPAADKLRDELMRRLACGGKP